MNHDLGQKIFSRGFVQSDTIHLMVNIGLLSERTVCSCSLHRTDQTQLMTIRILYSHLRRLGKPL